MFVRSRLRIIPVVLTLVLGAFALSACRKAATKTESAELSGDKVKRQIEALKPGITELMTKFSALHKQIDPLPPELPGFDAIRSKFYGTDEVVGRMSVKLQWLSDRLDAAVKSGDRTELEQVSKDAEQTVVEIRHVNAIYMELVHAVPPFERLAKQLQAEAAGTPAPSASAARK